MSELENRIEVTDSTIKLLKGLVKEKYASKEDPDKSFIFLALGEILLNQKFILKKLKEG